MLVLHAPAKGLVGQYGLKTSMLETANQSSTLNHRPEREGEDGGDGEGEEREREKEGEREQYKRPAASVDIHCEPDHKHILETSVGPVLAISRMARC